MVLDNRYFFMCSFRNQDKRCLCESVAMNDKIKSSVGLNIKNIFQRKGILKWK